MDSQRSFVAQDRNALLEAGGMNLRRERPRMIDKSFSIQKHHTSLVSSGRDHPRHWHFSEDNARHVFSLCQKWAGSQLYVGILVAPMRGTPGVPHLISRSEIILFMGGASIRKFEEILLGRAPSYKGIRMSSSGREIPSKSPN